MNITAIPTPLMPPSSNNTQINGTQSDTNDSDPTQRLWDIRWFFLLGVPLLIATIFLPLVAGPTVRWLLQMSLKPQRFLPIYLSVQGIAWLICGYLFILAPQINIALVTICDISILLTGAFHLYRALKAKENRLMWGFFVALGSACLVVDEATKVPVVMGIFAWAIFFLIRLQSYGYLELALRWCLLSFNSARRVVKRVFVRE